MFLINSFSQFFFKIVSGLKIKTYLVLAALIADNRTIINRIYHLDRGYEFLEKKLKNCKARIKRI